jgi:hypothetical protein
MSPEALLALEQTSLDVLGSAVSGAGVTSRLAPPRIAAITCRRAPPWLMAVRGELNDLQRLPTNWDSYGAIQISRHSVAAAFDVLRQIVSVQTPAPSIVPNCDGSVQLEWHINGCDLEVRVHSQARIGVLFEDHRNEANGFETELEFDLTPLRHAVTRLSE